jgi:4-hydroxy-3-methylbut-2-enyl diphosphate reductase IspH
MYYTKEFVHAAKFFKEVCTKQKTQLKIVIKICYNNMIFLVILTVESSNKIKQLEASANISTNEYLIKKNDKVKTKLASPLEMSRCL